MKLPSKAEFLALSERPEEKVPEGWLTMAQIREKYGLNRKAAYRRMHVLLAGGAYQTRKFRQGSKWRPYYAPLQKETPSPKVPGRERRSASEPSFAGNPRHRR